MNTINVYAYEAVRPCFHYRYRRLGEVYGMCVLLVFAYLLHAPFRVQ